MQDENKTLAVIEEAAALTRCPDGKCQSFPVPFVVIGERSFATSEAFDAIRHRFLRFAYTGDCEKSYACEDYLDQQVDHRANGKPTAAEWDSHIDAAIKLAIAAGVWSLDQ